MVYMNPETLLNAFQNAHNEYFHLLMKHYPSGRQQDQDDDFAAPRLYELAIEVHACSIALGPTPLKRLCALGLEQLYPFDNPVDIYTWRVEVRQKNIPHTLFASIAIRIDSELARMRRLLALTPDAPIDKLLPDRQFLRRSGEPFFPESKTEVADTTLASIDNPASASVMYVGSIHVNSAPEHQAVSKLERLEKTTAIGSHSSTIINAIRLFFGT
ncbi:hypothetical protein DM611_16840 [Stenotrophomonas maltophilia]|nr:hypothetical protein DM611_16840 [Stenotrophomonas maltophilia]